MTMKSRGSSSGNTLNSFVHHLFGRLQILPLSLDAKESIPKKIQ